MKGQDSPSNGRVVRGDVELIKNNMKPGYSGTMCRGKALFSLSVVYRRDRFQPAKLSRRQATTASVLDDTAIPCINEISLKASEFPIFDWRRTKQQQKPNFVLY